MNVPLTYPPSAVNGLMISGMLTPTGDENFTFPKSLKEELLAECRIFIHGCTVATNTLINHSGARVGMITTAGFEDTMEIMRASALVQGLPAEAWFHKGRNTKPFPVIPRERVAGVAERMDLNGDVVVPLSVEHVRSAAEALVRDKGCEAVSICFLWSFVNPRHEMEAKQILAEEYPGIYVDCSHEVVGLMGEYERFSTTVLNSYLRPEVESYISDLKKRQVEAGMVQTTAVNQSCVT